MTDVIIIGAMKCGTTTIWAILKSHPEINPCNEKEPGFFLFERNWNQNLDKYHSKWDPSKAGLKLEGSTHYTKPQALIENVPKKLWEYNPNLKLIYIARHPIERVISQFMHYGRKGIKLKAIEDEIRSNQFENSFSQISHYGSVVDAYLKYFSRDQLLLLTFDDLIEKREQLVDRLADFLSVDKNKFSDVQKVHGNRTLGRGMKRSWYKKFSIKYKIKEKYLPKVLMYKTENIIFERPSLDKSVQRAYLQNLDGEIDRYASLTNKDLSHWKNSKN